MSRHAQAGARSSETESQRFAIGYVPADIVAKMRSLLPSQSKEVVMDALGISSNTWLKLKKGEPVRSSLVDRLLRRFGEASSTPPSGRSDH